MPFQKRKELMNAFFTSQFSYCPLTWMFHIRKLNNKINRLHERCLCVVYNDRLSSFKKLLNKDNSVSIHHRNLQCLATEMFKVHLGEAPQVLQEVFPLTEPSTYNLRFQHEFGTRPIRTIHYGSNSQPSKLGKMADGKKLPSYMYYLMAVWCQKFQCAFFVVSIIKSHKQMLKCFLKMIFIDVTH